MATNPAMSLPRAGAVRAALGKLELFVVSDNVVANDTVAAGPHVLLPAAAWGEKDGTVTNSERRISRQRAFVPLPGEAMPDWWMVAEVAQRMGFASAFNFRNAADVFREHAALSAFENDGTRAFDIGALAAISDEDYEVLDPVQWPMPAGRPGDPTRLFANGGFFTDDRKARFVAPEPPALCEPTSAEFPFRLNTGRLRDQWHSMTRSGLSPRLGAHRPEPFVEVHPLDAKTHGLAHGGFARLTTAHGSCVLKVVASAGQQRGSLFVPIHWSDANASSARVGDLVAPCTDPFSGQPEAKATPVTIAPVAFAFRGFALSRAPLALPDGTWWARVAVNDAQGCLFASNDGPMTWHELAPRLFEDAVLTEYVDRKRSLYRAAAFADGRLDGALFIGPADAPPQWSDLRSMVGGPGIAESGPVVCACFGVGLAALHEAIASRKAVSIDEIGTALRAGTKCGTCLPELRSILAHETSAHARARAL
jgi:assimilatory nitrate reductase catalytic subunit